jgi:TBCC domain-containing protein 1
VATASPVLRPRRESFEHGLLPIPKLVFPEGTLTQTLAQLKGKLAASGSGRVGAAALAEALQIPAEQAALALGTLAAVLPADDDPADGPDEADLRDVLLFLYIQSYKRLVPRAHKDSPSVADVWPSTSAFDGYLSALSPIQVRFRSIPAWRYSLML